MNAGRYRQLSGCVILLMFLFAARASAQTMLQWDASLEPPPVAGYQVLSGPSSGNYTNSVSVGNVTSYVLPAMTAPTYLAVKAVGTDGLISPPSAEVVYTPGCFNGKVISPTNTLWTFTVKASTKGAYIAYVSGLGGWTSLITTGGQVGRSSSGGNWLLQFRCDR